MDQPSDDSPCKRLRVSEGHYIDEETGVVIDGNLLEEVAAVGDDSQSNTSRGERETIDAKIPNTSDRIVAAAGDMINNHPPPWTGPLILDRRLPDVLCIPQNCGDGYQPFTNTQRNRSEGSIEARNQSADRIQTSFQLQNENVATCVGFSGSKLNDTTNTDLLNDANKSDKSNPESAESAPEREPTSGICDYVQNIQAFADNSYPRLRENTCLISTYDRNTSRSKTDYVPNLESPNLKRTLDRANTNLAKKRMESLIDSAVDEARNSKSLADIHVKEVYCRESDRGELSPGSCSVKSATENEKGDVETESKLEEPVNELEPGTIFMTGTGSEENHEADFNIHSHTSMKIHAVDTIGTDERSEDVHRNNQEETGRLSDMSESTGQIFSDMLGDAKKERIKSDKDSDDNIRMQHGTYKELMKNLVDLDDNKKNTTASGSGILQNMDDSGFMEMFSNSTMGSIMSSDMKKGSSLTWNSGTESRTRHRTDNEDGSRNSGKKSQTGCLSQGSLTLNRTAVTDSRETNLTCSFDELNNLLEDISGGNVNEGNDLVGVDTCNRNDTLDESLTFVPSSSVQNIITCSQSSSSLRTSSTISMCSHSSASPQSSSKSTMCSQLSTTSRSSANSRTYSQSSSSPRSNTSEFSESKTLQTKKQTLGVTASTTFSDIDTVSFQAFHVPTATLSTSDSDRTDDSLVFNDTVPTDLYQVSHVAEENVPQCSGLQLDGVNTEQESKECVNDELIDGGRLRPVFENVRDGVIETNKDLRESGHDRHGLILTNGRLKLDFDQTQEIISQNNINSLPITVLVNILRHLTVFELLRRASLVCKYWYNQCRDPDIWRSVNLANQDRLTDEDLIRLLTFGEQRVRDMNLTDCRCLTDHGLNYLLRNCLQIEVLRVMRCFDLTDLAFKGLHRKGRCRKLYSLHLDGCCRTGTKALFELSEACPRMRDLHLNHCMKVCDAGIASMARRCPNLVNLQLDHCKLVTDDAISEIVLGCPGMRELNLMSCSITDRGVKYLSKLLKLRNIDLSNIPRLTSDSVVYMSRFCKDLQCVNVSLNTAINDHCIAQIAHNLPMLRRLYCVSCSLSDKGLQDIAKYRPTIETLDVGWCQDVTDHGVRVISLACNHLDYFGLIRCDRVSVETIEELVLRYPRINYSTFFLESRKLLDRARSEGYTFSLPGFKLRNSQQV